MDKEVIDILKSKKLRVTIPRIKILRILKDASIELTATDIQKKLFHQNSAKISSIYHVLRELEKVGIIQRYKDGDIQASFSFKKSYSAIRFICSACKTIFTLETLQEKEERSLVQLIESLSKKHQYELNSFTLTVNTLCVACTRA
ncbi:MULTISPECIES: Fur family transcriptional regulator [Acinetobacter]|jgi:Fe2+ or Zn2+ uptake regulation protein|uniref:Transcriptional repressor n=1 Tax=Acinetobacter courvalinii TaxID=280147 RepID=N9RK46_9GAMM|nr:MULTISPECIES: transcriptional repressor [Acinetobacter]RSN79524.1 hypothetical protein EA770_18275 [Acinetobacter baumannii]ENX39522.1 hypothetical protein F888_00994 [Acinetobacter courvalinii]KAB0661010.1 hypothetical protein F7P77_04955 [Acinetobacter courvalinii]MEB3793182.1 transcriptional repressor [Acinetobacter sp. IK40]GGH38542.1 transcriptional repressor [Acinetobacter courvalinii]